MLRFIHHSFFMCGVKDVCDDYDVRFGVTMANASDKAFNIIVLNAFFVCQCNVVSLFCFEQFCAAFPFWYVISYSPPQLSFNFTFKGVDLKIAKLIHLLETFSVKRSSVTKLS